MGPKYEFNNTIYIFVICKIAKDIMLGFEHCKIVCEIRKCMHLRQKKEL